MPPPDALRQIAGPTHRRRASKHHSQEERENERKGMNTRGKIILLGSGERLFEGIDVRALGYDCIQFVASEKATHVVLRRQGHNDA